MKRSNDSWRKVPWILAFLLLLGGMEALGREGDEKDRKKPPAPEEEKVELSEVEVVASPIVEPAVTTRYGTQVSTVTEAQMDALNAQDLPSALRRVPGVAISRYNLVGSYGGREGGGIFIRGLGGARPGAGIAAMVDGIPKVVGVWAHPLMDVLSIDNAERIDVYKTPQPVLYGNMAFAAVDLETKRSREPGFETRVFAASGSYDTVMEKIEHGGKVDRFDYYITQSMKSSRGHRTHSAGKLEDYYVRLGYELADSLDVNFSYMHTDNRAEDPGPEGGPVPDRDRYDVRDSTYIFAMENHTGRAEGFLKVYADDGDIDWAQYDTEPFDSVTGYLNYGVRGRQALHLWKGGEVILGLDYDVIGGDFIEERPSGDRYTGSDESFTLIGPYAAASQLIGDEEGWHAVPSAGIRFTNHDKYDDLWAPQCGLVCGYGETELHAEYARGFNYPGVYAVFMSESQWNTADAWKRLDPEILDHIEVGLSHRVFPWLKAETAVFKNDGSDRLIFVAPPPPPPRFENIGRFKTEGVEVTFDITPEAPWSAFLGASILKEVEPFNLPYAPKKSLSGGFSYTFLERWRLDVDGQYISAVYTTNPRFPFDRNRVSDYWLCNGKISYRLTPEKSPTTGTLFAAVDNIFDENYEYRLDYPMPGAILMAGVEVRF